MSSGRIKLVVGFHPDQATEPCIDLAMVLGVPFCVVPCCVFPSEFPDRRLRLSPSVMQQQQRSDGDDRNGNDDDYEQEEQLVLVRNYNQFLDYLRQKPTTNTESSTISSISSSSSPGDDEARITTTDSSSSNIIHTAYLDFPFTETAKNVVLYTLPSLPPTGDGSK